MSVKLFAFTCGHVTSVRAAFLEGESGQFTVPVPAYLIVHDEGNVVFDTGLNLAIRQEKARLLGPTADDWDIDFPGGADIASQLARLGIAPCDIRYVVNSHLHYDHCGGNVFFPNATLIVHAREWRAAQRSKVMQAAGVYNPLRLRAYGEVARDRRRTRPVRRRRRRGVPDAGPYAGASVAAGAAGERRRRAGGGLLLPQADARYAAPAGEPLQCRRR